MMARDTEGALSGESECKSAECREDLVLSWSDALSWMSCELHRIETELLRFEADAVDASYQASPSFEDVIVECAH